MKNSALIMYGNAYFEYRKRIKEIEKGINIKTDICKSLTFFRNTKKIKNINKTPDKKERRINTFTEIVFVKNIETEVIKRYRGLPALLFLLIFSNNVNSKEELLK
jgi:hypothetical protein